MFTDTHCSGGGVSALMMLGLLLGGCSGWASPPPGDPQPARLEVIDEAAFAKVLEAHRGKVVLVDFWATWCEPCMELFPHTVQLHKRFANRGLVVISVSLDDPDENRQTAIDFLSRQGAAFEHFISRYGAGTRSVEAFKLDGPLPQMKLYDGQGRVHQSFGGQSGEVDPQQLDRAVEELLRGT
jgi:cytochrome c biogenesis protein CcmG/thiol:disulfide interchange protein DsbE